VLIRLLVQQKTFFEHLKQYVGFTETSSGHLRALHPQAALGFEAIVDDFYAAIERQPEARAVLTGADAEVMRLKHTLRAWLDGLLLGPHDETYYEARARIGRAHVRVGLPQALMFTAMNRIRTRLAQAVRQRYADDPELEQVTSTALHQVLDLELAIMLETYREDLEAKHRSAERMSTIGQLATGIGHELRNPLAVIESSVFLLRQHLARVAKSDAYLERHLDKIAAEVHRSNKTIDDLLELARSRPPQRQRLEAAKLVRHALSLVPSPPGIAVTVVAPPGVTLHGDPDQLAHILANLLLNAHQAMGEAGAIRLEVWREGQGTCIRVRDDGPGVPARDRERVFQPLYTTKAKGIGLGLALCRRIAEAHGGSLVLEPTETGASFVLAVPDEGRGAGP
jgi:two-component system, NtrC family, sensor histidine kinase HydH